MNKKQKQIQQSVSFLQIPYHEPSQPITRTNTTSSQQNSSDSRNISANSSPTTPTSLLSSSLSVHPTRLQRSCANGFVPARRMQDENKTPKQTFSSAKSVSSKTSSLATRQRRPVRPPCSSCSMTSNRFPFLIRNTSLSLIASTSLNSSFLISRVKLPQVAVYPQHP